jgi:hypothetical protein
MLENPEQLKLLKPRRQHKYHSRPVWVDGIRFASKAEGAEYVALKLEYPQLRIVLQPRFVIRPKTDVFRAVTYVGDFQYDTFMGSRIVLDVKGMETRVFKSKWKAVQKLYPKITFRKIVMDSKQVNELLALAGARVSFTKG